MAKKIDFNLDLNKIQDQFRNLNPQDVGTWPILPRILALAGIVVVVLFLGWYLQWKTQLEQLEAGHQEEETLKEQYRQKLQKAINLEPLRKQKELVSQYVIRLEKQLPSKAEMDALLTDINQAGVGRGLQFELFKPGQVTVRDYYAELPITIKINGGYHDLGAFTGDIAGLPRIVTLNNLKITAPQQGLAASPLTMEATAKTFRYLDPEEVAAQQQAQAQAKKGGAK